MEAWSGGQKAASVQAPALKEGELPELGASVLSEGGVGGRGQCDQRTHVQSAVIWREGSSR